MITFTYEEPSGGKSNGTIQFVKKDNLIEAEIVANGWTFHVIVGRHKYGNFICIPNWNIGSELAKLSDYFWNYERLRNYTTLETGNASVIASALATLGEHQLQLDII